MNALYSFDWTFENILSYGTLIIIGFLAGLAAFSCITYVFSHELRRFVGSFLGIVFLGGIAYLLVNYCDIPLPLNYKKVAGYAMLAGFLVYATPTIIYIIVTGILDAINSRKNEARRERAEDRAVKRKYKQKQREDIQNRKRAIKHEDNYAYFLKDNAEPEE